MLERLNGETRLFPIIGDPIIYAKSPERFTGQFAARGHNGICVPMQVAEADLEPVMRGLSLIPNVDGLLVTMPHKFNAFAYCATSSQRSRLLNVVSAMRRNADGTWHGDMFDGLAFVKAQIDEGARPLGARVLLVGAGGAGGAIAIALLEAGVRELVIHDRNETRAARLIALLAGLGAGHATSGPPDPTGCDIVCNATPMGMAEGDPLPVAADSACRLDVRLRRDRRSWGDAPVAGGACGWLQNDRRRADGRGRSGNDARLHAWKIVPWLAGTGRRGILACHETK